VFDCVGGLRKSPSGLQFLRAQSWPRIRIKRASIVPASLACSDLESAKPAATRLQFVPFGVEQTCVNL